MLVLSRHVSESLLIGDDIRITILKSDPYGCVSIGIEAPRDIVVIREELRTRATPTNAPSRSPLSSSSSDKPRGVLTRWTRKVFATT